jgi:hypothetical protein
MAPRDKGSLDRGSLSSEIEIKVLQLFPMVLENSDISRYDYDNFLYLLDILVCLYNIFD